MRSPSVVPPAAAALPAAVVLLFLALAGPASHAASNAKAPPAASAPSAAAPTAQTDPTDPSDPTDSTGRPPQARPGEDKAQAWLAHSKDASRPPQSPASADSAASTDITASADSTPSAGSAASNHVVEYVVIGMFFVFMIAIGLVSRRLVSSFSDYFRSGCKATWWLVGMSSFMASFSAWTFTGAASVAFESGISVAVIFFTAVVGLVISAVFTAPWFRQLRAITFPEVVDGRFGTATQQMYLWLGVVPMMGYAALSLLGVAVFTSAVFGFKVWVIVVVLGAVVLAYSTIGGSWSVLTTDFLQALLLMPLALLISILSLKSIGGFDGLLGSLRAQGLDDHLRMIDSTPGSKYTVWFALAMLAFQIFTWNSLNSAGRYFWCKDGRDARRSAWLASGLFLVGALIWFIPPIVARLQFAPQVLGYEGKLSNPADAAYAVAALQLLPNGLAGLVVVAMFSATMSSIDLSLNQVAAIVTQDFYKKFFNPQASDRRILVIGQMASFAFGIVIIAIAAYLSLSKTRGLFDMMLKVGSLFSTPFIVPMVLTLFLRKAPWWSAGASVLVGAVVSFFAGTYEWSYPATVFSILAAGSLAYLVSLPFWSGESEDYKRKVAAFYEKMERPVDFESEVGGAIDTRQMRMLGWFSFAVGGFIALLTALPNPASGRAQIACLAGAIGGLGALMLWAAGALDRKNAAKPAAATSSGAEAALERDGARSVDGAARSAASPRTTPDPASQPAGSE